MQVPQTVEVESAARSRSQAAGVGPVRRVPARAGFAATQSQALGQLRWPAEESTHARRQDRHISDQDSDHVATLRENTVECETDSESKTRVSSIVDRPVAEIEEFDYSGSDGH